MASSRPARPLNTICISYARKQPLQRRGFASANCLRFEDIRTDSRLPRVATSNFWSSLIPKPFRAPRDTADAAERARLKAARKAKPSFWSSPYSTFILLAILVGSNAIQILTHRQDMLNFSRKTDAKLELLREVVQKVKRGEKVDVRKALGTGDPEAEKEWDDVMKEIEETDHLWEGKKKRDKGLAESTEETRLQGEQASDTRDVKGSASLEKDGAEVLGEEVKRKRPKFMM